MVAFIVLLVASATELSSGATDSANVIAVYGYYALVVGVALQIASYAKRGEAGASSPQNEAPQTTPAPQSKWLPRNTKLAAVAAVTLMLLAGVVVGFPMLSHPGAASGTSARTPSSGCLGPQGDGTVFISTNATVSIEICGKVYTVPAGAGGGLTYSYHAGIVNFTAPSSVNGSVFEFWYATIGGNTPTRVSGETLTLALPAGLSFQDSLIQLYYTAPPASGSTALVANTTLPTPSATNNTTSNTSSSASSTTVAFRQGSDGGVFVSTNLNATVSIDICGQPVPVPGGVGGGLDFSYQPGDVTFVAPPTADGMPFKYWYVLLPSEEEQVMSNQLTVDLAAGYVSGNSFVEAFYG